MTVNLEDLLETKGLLLSGLQWNLKIDVIKKIENDIDKKFGEIIKNSYSKDNINKAFLENSESWNEKKAVYIAQILLNAGADVNTKSDVFETTALIIAAGMNDLPLVKSLIQNQADVNAKK
ncbi:ankyrin repeat domain-containing protein [Candidatus Dependentiae bacterium]|nr:ankyrin repeat domain-containing protein [Candidatus Dependentiae bacterium]